MPHPRSTTSRPTRRTPWSRPPVRSGWPHVGTDISPGCSPLITQFSSENGAGLLTQHFEDVSRRDVTTWATFPGHAAAATHLSSFDPSLAEALPLFTGERRYDGFTTVFTAR